MIRDRLRPLRFALVGGAVTALYYLMLMAFTSIGVNYLVANTIGWSICVCLNFILNRRFTFRRTTATGRAEVIGFALTYGLQYMLGMAVLALAVEVGGLELTAAFLVTLAATTFSSYLVLGRLVFTRPQAQGRAR